MSPFGQLQARAEILMLALALIVQLGLGVWWAADVSRRIVGLEEWRTVSQANAVRLTRIEADNDSQGRDLNGIRTILERIETKITDTQRTIWEHVAAHNNGGGKKQ